jgi:hypothetical protein
MRRWRPSLGCWLLVVVHLLAVGFFAWGLSRPELDRVWTLYHSLRIGRMPRLSAEDRRLFDRALERFPRLTPALLDQQPIGLLSEHRGGWLAGTTATILRSPLPEANRLRLEVRTPARQLPLRVEIHANHWRREVRATRPGPVDLELPPAKGPELFELRLKGAPERLETVRVSFPGVR